MVVFSFINLIYRLKYQCFPSKFKSKSQWLSLKLLEYIQEDKYIIKSNNRNTRYKREIRLTKRYWNDINEAVMTSQLLVSRPFYTCSNFSNVGFEQVIVYRGVFRSKSLNLNCSIRSTVTGIRLNHLLRIHIYKEKIVEIDISVPNICFL